MKARLTDLSIGMDGKQRITLALCGDFREQYDALKEHDLSVEIKRFRRRRSLDANAYAWVLIDKLAQATGVRKEEVYREAIRNIGGASDTVCVPTKAVAKLRESWRRNGMGWQTEIMPSKLDGCTNVTLYYGSSVYDTKQMSDMINLLVQDCRELGIETLPPRDLEALEAQWR